jgi:hypothetical protein
MLKCYGERGIRTLAPLTQSNPLAEGPLEPLGYLSKLDAVRCTLKTGFETSANVI